MKIIVDGFGKTISKRDNQILIKENGKEKKYFLAKDISQIIITGKGSITFDALNLLAKNSIDCISINWHGFVDYKLYPPENKNISLRKEQYYSLNDKRSGFLAKSFIKAKIQNQRALLGTWLKSRDDPYLLEQRNKLDLYLNKVNKVNNRPIDEIRGQLFGIEGQSSHEYWEGFKRVIDKKWNFLNRSGRNAQDPINAMLNYGYAILQGEIWRETYLAGLDPYCGFLHSDRYGRVSLVYDIMEEFRQQIVDRSVISIFNNKQLKKKDFEPNNELILLSDKARQLIITKILKKIHSSIKYNDKQMSFSKIINYQCKLLTHYLMNKQQYIGFSLRW